MKPSSILLLAAAGLSSALPAQPGTANGVQARDSRSLFGHAINAIAARNLVPLNANTAAPPPAADPAAGKKEAPPAADPAAGKKEAPAAAPPAAKPTEKKAGDAKATDAAATTTAAAATTTAAAADAAATTVAATTTSAAPAIETTAVAVGNGTASDNGKGKGNGKGNGKDNGKNNGQDKGQGKGKHNNNNNNNNGNNALSSAIAGALNTLGLDGVLDASSLDKLSVGSQISLLAQIVSLQTMKDLQMVGGQDIVIVLNQGFKSNGLNIVINA
ncbi:hypothetical protein TsFJ059_000912 [Trichoderma semiorbis]|uniref:Uncharacterized protein n=1 Tax=Trichoderma semiorbis TaxID=1491008 RepID=A0A9P8HYB4_9HYPO|nr:hypothetical protein TsFJ059_000912 [Trichoderma semiorbis]